MPTILAKAIELLCIVIHSVGFMPEGQQFPHLPIHKPLRNVVALEGLLEFIPSNSMSSLLHGLEMFPPHQGFTRSYKAAKLAFFSSEHGCTKAENLASMALIHASASRGSSALEKVGAFIPMN
jgi:hypothetical protein